MQSTKNIKKRGFTVLETIVSISIVSLAITGVFSSVRSITTSSTRVKDEVTAFYLVREGFEIVRNKRDSNQLSRIVTGASTHWLASMSAIATNPCYFGRVCRVEHISINPSFSLCPGGTGTCIKLRQDTLGAPGTVNFLYRYGLAYPETKYRRQISFERISDDEVAVTVVVSWTDRGRDYEVMGKTLLFNWL